MQKKGGNTVTNVWYYHFPIGKVGIAEDGTGICAVFFPDGKIVKETKRTAQEKSTWTEAESPLIQQAYQQLNEYFEGKRKVFDLPLSLKGTDFQLQDWKALQTIPYGETRTYGQIAQLIGRPKACRAVGMANHNNPVNILIPCHRVIGQTGSLVGYGGGLPIKEYLLNLEKKVQIESEKLHHAKSCQLCVMESFYWDIAAFLFGQQHHNLITPGNKLGHFFRSQRLVADHSQIIQLFTE